MSHLSALKAILDDSNVEYVFLRDGLTRRDTMPGKQDELREEYLERWIPTVTDKHPVWMRSRQIDALDAIIDAADKQSRYGEDIVLRVGESIMPIDEPGKRKLRP